MLFGYSLSLHGNIEHKTQYGSEHYGGVLYGMSVDRSRKILRYVRLTSSASQCVDTRSVT